MRGRGGRGRRDRHAREEYGRTTITVPSELKQRMKAVGDYVNWSAVACKAFDAKLNELLQQEEIENLDQVVERMRKLTAERSDSEECRTGFETGKRWAMNRATPTQLASLEAFRDEMSESEWRDTLNRRGGVRKLTRCLMQEEPERGRGRRFWKEILDEKPEHPDFFIGFADGALDIWKAVKDRV